MAGAAAPILIGSAVGAVTNRKNPLQGALLGGALGGFGSAFTGFGSLGNAAANTANTAATTVANTTANTAANTAATNLMPGAVGAFGQPVPAMASATPGIFSNATYPLAVSQPLSSAAGQTAGMETTFGPVELLLNPNIQSSSLNDESLLQKIGTGAGELGQYAQQNPVLTQMAMQSAQQMMQQPQRQASPPGLLRGSQMQVAAPQYQVGIPKVSLI